MSVCQVEEYYLYINDLKISGQQKEAIEEHLSNEGFNNYEFQDGDTVLVVDDIPDESSGEMLEEEILALT